MQAEVFAVIFFIAGLLAYLRHNFHRIAEERFKYKVFALRDKLRELAYNGEIEQSSFIFEYLDRSFSIAVKKSYYFSVWHLVFLTAMVHHDAERKAFFKKVKGEALKNKATRKLFEEYTLTIVDYIRNQSWLSIRLLMPIFNFSSRLLSIKNSIRRAAVETVATPEFSDAGRHLQTV